MPRKRFKFLFDPSKKGIRRVLGELEADIMEILWTHGPATVREVHERLNENRPLAYTTVMTVMSRLATKGLLAKTKDGAAFTYKAATSRDEFTAESVRSVIQGLLKDFSKPAMSQFVDSLRDRNELEELERLLGEEKKKR
jgi:predicted transcriptional regulator